MFQVIRSIQEKAATQGFAPAVINGTWVLTYQDLLDLLARVSNHFLDRRLPAGSRLFLNVADPDLRLIITLAAFHAGMVPFVTAGLGPLNPEIDFDFVVGSPQPAVEGLPADIVIDESVLAGKLSDPVLRDVPDRGDDDFLFFVGTTGTTGAPKMVVERYGPFGRKDILRQYPPTGEDDRFVITLGDLSKYGFGQTLRALFFKAAVIRPDPDPQAMLRNMNLYGATHLLTTPNVLERFVGVMERTGVRVPSMRWIAVGGALVNPSLAERASKVFEVELEFSYGSSEVGGIAHGIYDPATYEYGYIGTLDPGVVLLGVGTRESPAPLVLLNNRNIFCEYYSNGKAEKIEKTFYPMPDVGFLEGGKLYLVGREDEVLNVSGVKLPFSQIETAIRGQPGIVDVGLAPATADLGMEGLVVGVVTERHDFKELAEAVAAMLGKPAVKLSLHVVRVPGIRRNQTGKVDRGALIQAYRNASASVA